MEQYDTNASINEVFKCHKKTLDMMKKTHIAIAPSLVSALLEQGAEVYCEGKWVKL